MRIQIILFSFCFFLFSETSFSQKFKSTDKGVKEDKELSIIQDNVAIKKYHRKDELERMQKSQLLVLYKERIEALVKVLPYIAFATEPGITMADLGIPDANRSRMEDQYEATNDFLEETEDFQKDILPYSDTKKLIFSILFYEETLRSLRSYSEFD